MEPFLIWSALILSLPFITTGPKTTVILLDNNTTHNGIDVSSQLGTVSIDQPYYATTLSASDKKPSDVEKMDPSVVNAKYADVLGHLPNKAVSMLFYFEPGTAEIAQSSKDQVEELIKVVALQEPASVDIVGHSDRAGDADKNYELALKRAHSVEKFLLDRKVNLERISVVSHGENDPLVPTEDGVDEPQNRRVEVIVR
jgi:OmpA-OmpF porin, OOP family